MTEYTRDYPINGYEDCTETEKAEIQRALDNGIPPGSLWLYPTPDTRSEQTKRQDAQDWRHEHDAPTYGRLRLLVQHSNGFVSITSLDAPLGKIGQTFNRNIEIQEIPYGTDPLEVVPLYRETADLTSARETTDPIGSMRTVFKFSELGHILMK